MNLDKIDSGLYRKYSLKYDEVIKGIYDVAVKKFVSFERDLKKFIANIEKSLKSKGFDILSKEIFAADELVYRTGKKVEVIDIAEMDVEGRDTYKLVFQAVLKDKPSVRVAIYENGNYLTSVDAVSETTITAILG